MKAIVYADLASAQAAIAAIDRTQGYPRTYAAADVASGLVRLSRGARLGDVRTDTYARPVLLRDGTYAVLANEEQDAARAKAAPSDVSRIQPTSTAVLVADAQIDPAAAAVDAPADAKAKP